jgi:multidrug transporter EmrE-like cation transporter
MGHVIIFVAIGFRTLMDLSFKFGVDGLRLDRTENIGSNLKLLGSRPWFWMGFLFGGINLGVWCLSLGHFDLSYAYPFFSIHYVAMILIGKILFKEKMDTAKWIGIGLIGIGISILVTS